MTPHPLDWLRYRSGTWHAFRSGQDWAACGGPSRRGSSDPRPFPGGHACRTCIRRLRRWGFPAPREDSRARRKEADDIAGRVQQQLHARHGTEAVTDPRLREAAAPAWDRLAAALLRWEVEPAEGLTQEVNDAIQAVYAAWEEVTA